MQFHKDEFYESIVLKKNVYKDMILSALEEVKKFIIERRLVLVGGMSIDMAMRAKGSALYDNEDSVPDYDFLSPNFHIDAYDLCLLLHEKKYPNVQVTNAKHITTMRVWVQFESVADISYVPPNIYERIPFVKYKGLRVVHPHYQVIDQHVSLGHPYAGTPYENIAGGRWNKDMKRHDLIIKYYPIDAPAKCRSDKHTELACAIVEDACIGGEVAIEYWKYRAGLMDEKMKKILPSSFEYEGSGKELKMKFKTGTITIYADDPEKVADRFEKKKVRYNSLLEKLPRCIKMMDSITIYDNWSNMIGAHKSKATFANLQVIMIESLSKWVMQSDPSALCTYKEAQILLSWASSKYAELDKIKTADSKKKNLLTFLPTSEVYGRVNWADSYKIHREKFKGLSDREQRRRDIPQALYMNQKPSENKIKKIREFVPGDSEIYKIDGEKTKKVFEKYILPSVD